MDSVRVAREGLEALEGLVNGEGEESGRRARLTGRRTGGAVGSARARVDISGDPQRRRRGRYSGSRVVDLSGRGGEREGADVSDVVLRSCVAVRSVCDRESVRCGATECVRAGGRGVGWRSREEGARWFSLVEQYPADVVVHVVAQSESGAVEEEVVGASVGVPGRRDARGEKTLLSFDKDGRDAREMRSANRLAEIIVQKNKMVSIVIELVLAVGRVVGVERHAVSCVWFGRGV